MLTGIPADTPVGLTRVDVTQETAKPSAAQGHTADLPSSAVVVTL